MDGHIKIVAVLHIVFGALGLLAGLIVCIALGGAAAITGIAASMSDAAIAVPILGIVGGVIFFILVLTSLPALIGGIGLLRNENWGRILIIIVSVLGLLNFPIGTIVGAYSLIVLLSPDASRYFEQQSTPPPFPNQY